MDIPDPPRIVRDVENEPHLLDRQRAAHWQWDAVLGEQAHHVVDDLLAVEDHTQPAEAGNEPHPAGGRGHRVGVRDPRGGVFAAEVSVAAEGERAGALWGFAQRLLEDDGREAGVKDGVEVPRDGVEGDEGAEGEAGRECEDELRVEEEAVEDVEGGGVGALVGECGGWGGHGGAFAFAGELDGVVDPARGGVVRWGNDEAACGG